MTMDYASNSRKSKEEQNKPKKEVEKVVVGEVVIKKKSIGAKLRDVFIEADFRSVSQYIIYDVLVPAARNTIVDVASKGIERMMYGDTAIRRRNYGPGPTRVTYNSPIDRSYGYSGGYRDRETNPPRGRLPDSRNARPSRTSRDDIVLTSREEAAVVLERMRDIIDTYEVVSVADLAALTGQPSTYIDERWGWIYLGDARIEQIREGWLLNLPAAEPIPSQ
jgi:hypothetical protein